MYLSYFLKSDVLVCVLAVCILCDAASSQCDGVGGLFNIRALF